MRFDSIGCVERCGRGERIDRDAGTRRCCAPALAVAHHDRPARAGPYG